MHHDPREFVRGLQQILVSDNKRIGFLSGAGTSMILEKPDGTDDKGNPKYKSLIPGTTTMTNIVVSELKDKNALAVKAIEKELNTDGLPFHIENLISKISQKELVVGTETLCGLNKTELHDLKKLIEEKIKQLVSIHNEVGFFDWEITHYKFAQWIHDATRKSCVEIFTTNYDYLFEISFEKFTIPYFDGFIGAYSPFFHSGSLEDDTLLKGWTKLWKLHGSLGWDYDEPNKKIIRTNKDSGKIMIFPSVMKYDNSKKQPYVSYIDRLSRFLRTDDTILFISGYSFGDQHINDTIINALAKSKTSNAIAFLYDDFDENSDVTKLAKEERRLSIYGKRNAVIGGRFGKWKLKNRPSEDDEIQISSYFDQDAAEPKDKSGDKDDEPLTLEGNFILVDFAKLVLFLSDLNYSNYLSKSPK
jgi:hypothetical protein